MLPPQLRLVPVLLDHLCSPTAAITSNKHIHIFPPIYPPTCHAAVDIRGHVMRTADLAGKVTIVVNVASHCGFTGEC